MKKNITLYLDAELAEEAKEVAGEQWLSRSNLVNKLLEQHIREFKQERADDKSNRGRSEVQEYSD